MDFKWFYIKENEQKTQVYVSTKVYDIYGDF